MKKNGFVFIETIVVIAILSTILIIIYASFNVIISNEKKRNTYDQSSYLYRVKSMYNLLLSNNINESIGDINEDEDIIELTCESKAFIDSNNINNKEVCKSYIKAFNINKMYVSKNSINRHNINDQKVLDYIKKKSFDIDNRYLLIIKFNDGNIAALHMIKQNISNTGENLDKETITSACIAEIQSNNNNFASILGFNENKESYNYIDDNTNNKKILAKYIANNTDINCAAPTLSKAAVDSSYVTFGSFVWGTMEFVPNENFVYYIKDQEATNISNSEIKSLYFRGVQNNNYVKFAEKDELWRILKINSDGSIKIVMDNPPSSYMVVYDDAYLKETFNGKEGRLSFEYESGTDGTENYEQNLSISMLNAIYDDYFNSNKLKSYLDEDSNTFCINVIGEFSKDNFYSKVPMNEIFRCSKVIRKKMGLLTAYDVNVAGANELFRNDAFYLYNPNTENNILTFSFYKSIKNANNKFTDFSYEVLQGTNGLEGNLLSSGLMVSSVIFDHTYVLKPVVTLKSGINFSLDTNSKNIPGSLNNPFIIGG